MSKKLTFHVPADLKTYIDAGQHNFFNILTQTLNNTGFSCKTRVQKRHAGRIAALGKDYHIFHIDGAVGPRALNIRKAQFFPFWSFENAGDRFAPRIGRMDFNPDQINAIKAQDFFNKICVRNLPAHPKVPNATNYAFIPLQGRILKRRSWQFATSSEIINTVLAQDPTRQIIVKPHPRETYSNAEQRFINGLADNPRITVSDTDTFGLLKNCAYVATQNSGVAFQGFLYQKPAILFANSDFHHICQTVQTPATAAKAFEKLHGSRPAFEKYIYWYLQLNCINAGRDDAPERIIEMLNECGWKTP